MNAVGALMVVGGAAALGHSMALYRERRVQELNALTHAIQRLETEIVYGMVLLPDALGRVAKGGGPCADLFQRAADALNKGESAAESWMRALEGWRKRSALTPEDVVPLERLSGVLGVSGAEDQSRHLRYVRSELVFRLEQARDRLPETTRLFRALGVCGGLALALLLL